MGVCKLCGQKAGFLRSVHGQCEQDHEFGKREAERLTQVALVSGIFEKLEADLAHVQKVNFVSDYERNAAMIKGFDAAVRDMLSDSLFSSEEESRVSGFMTRFGFNQATLNENGSFTHIAMAAIIRDLCEGQIPQRFKVDRALPFLLQEDEHLIWLFGNVTYAEEKTSRSYVGASQGVSIRVARGVYYRVGAFKGQPIESTNIVPIDNGVLGVTMKNLYFAGQRKAERIPIKKIVGLQPHDDGVVIHKDGRAKAQAFVVGEGWFLVNLIENISKWPSDSLRKRKPAV